MDAFSSRFFSNEKECGAGSCTCSGKLHRAQDDRTALSAAAADTGGTKGAGSVFSELAGQRADNPGARGADGVAEGDGTATGVDDTSFNAQDDRGLNRNSCESLVDFNACEVRGRGADSLQRGKDGVGGLVVQTHVGTGDQCMGFYGGDWG
jgi:hypothetical protein